MAAFFRRFGSFTRNGLLKDRLYHYIVKEPHKSPDRQMTGYSRDNEIPTIDQVRRALEQHVGAQKEWRGEMDKNHEMALLDEMETDQNCLPLRHMKDSFTAALIPLGSDVSVREHFINQFQHIRFGKILENLDILAVATSYKHNLDPSKGDDQKSPLCIVTALVDRIDLKELDLLPDCDIKLHGFVSGVGKSSIEVSMTMEQFRENRWKHLLHARFVMVARGPKNVKAVVNPLAPDGPEEEKLFEKGKDNKLLREEQERQSLIKTPPTYEERHLIHQLFLSTVDENSGSFKVRVKPEGSVWMEDTKLKNVIICFPQERNLYNKVFGGFLMRKATELAWATALVHSKSRPFCVAVDDILFGKPVDIGSLLYLSSQVVYTDGYNMQVMVYAEVVQPTTGVYEVTNVFHFTFTTRDVPVPKVMPKSYAESMLFLNGKRHYEAGGIN